MCKAIEETSKVWDTPSIGCRNLTKLLPNNNHKLTTANHRLVKTHIRKLTAQSYYSALQLTFAADKSNRSCDRIVTALFANSGLDTSVTSLSCSDWRYSNVN